MIPELIGGHAAANGREQMGRFLRYAYPLGLESFSELLRNLEEDQPAKAPSRDTLRRAGAVTRLHEGRG